MRRAFLIRNRRGLGVIVQAPAGSPAAIWAANQAAAPSPTPGSTSTSSAPADPSAAPARLAMQNAVLQLKANSLQGVESSIQPGIINSGGIMPAGAWPIVQASSVGYPAAGAGATAVLTYTPAAGTVLVITQLAITHIGGNPPDFTGNVIWRVSVAGIWVNGMESMQYQSGTQAAPAQISPLIIQEGQQFQVTVEVPAGKIAPGGGALTAARLLGYTVPTSSLYQQPS